MCVAEIEAKLKELDEINQKINEMKKVVKCPDCGAESPVGSLFCSRCGASLSMGEDSRNAENFQEEEGAASTSEHGISETDAPEETETSETSLPEETK